MNRTTPAGLHPNIHAITFDETKHCNFGEDAEHVDSLETVRFYDSGEVTYLCEITPSYALYYVDSRVNMKEHCYDGNGDLLPRFERLRDNLECEIRRYEEEVTYMHASDVDVVAAKSEPYRHYGFGPEKKTRRWIEKHIDKGYDGFIDSMREYMQGNAVV